MSSYRQKLEEKDQIVRRRTKVRRNKNKMAKKSRQMNRK